MNLRLSLLSGVALAVLAFVALLGSADTVRGGTFNPVLEVQVADARPGAHSNFTVDFDLLSGDVNFAAVIAFIPQAWGVTPGDDLPIGLQVGTLTSTATLGLINGPCNNLVPVQFTMLNGSIDPADTVKFLDGDANGTGDVFEDKNGNGIQDGIEKYPDFITRIPALKDGTGQPLQPLRRAAGIAQVGGLNVLLQLVTFAPGTVFSPFLPSDPALGYPSVTLLQNIGDPEVVPAPSPITDFCTPLLSSTLSLGQASDGTVLYTNPPEGQYSFSVIALGQRDADGDGYENGLDTCPFAANQGDPRVASSGDADGDGLDAACDPNDNSDNSDEDGDGYDNRGDNCPLVANGQDGENQKDSDGDQIGDVCDTAGNGPGVPDGDLAFAFPAVNVDIEALPIEEQLGSCLPVTNIAWGHNNVTKVWSSYDPDLPVNLQQLTQLAPDGGYFLNVSANCTIDGEGHNIPIYTGWDLFGW